MAKRRVRRTKRKVAFRKKRVQRTKRKVSFKRKKRTTASTVVNLTAHMDSGQIVPQMNINDDLTPVFANIYVANLTMAGAADFLARKSLYKEFRVKSVTYRLSRDGKPYTPEIARATYNVADFMFMLPNPTDELVPSAPTTAAQDSKTFGYFQNEPRVSRVPITKTVIYKKVPVVIGSSNSLVGIDGSNYLVTKHSKFPWLSMQDPEAVKIAFSRLVVCIPGIRANTMHPIRTLANAPGLTKTEVVELFSYDIHATVKWQVRGTWNKLSLFP